MTDKAAAVRLKKLWRSSAMKQGVSLKQFARALLKSGDKLAERWFNNKDGACNQERSGANKTRASLERQATKQAKRKKKSASAE